MDDLDAIVASICASMDAIGNTLLREAEAIHELRMDAGKALEAQTEALAAINDYARENA